MEQWLDSLSEDWVSQPRSQHSSSIFKDSHSTDSKGSRSRIPRPTSLGSLNAANKDQVDLMRSTSQKPTGSQSNVLKVRTPSQLNASRTHTPDRSTKFSASRLGTTASNASRAASVTKRSTPQGTVQLKISPTKSQKSNATPEWRRRLVNGKDGSNEGSDLLSPKPVGLQGVFKPPTMKGKAQHSAISKRKSAKDLKEQGSQQKHPTGLRQPRRKEEAVESRANPTYEASLPMTTVQMRQDISIAEQDVKQKGQEPSLNDASLSKSNDFSPVLISKQNTADGGINYEAIDDSMHRLRSNMEQFRLEHQKRSSTPVSEPERPRSSMSSTGRLNNGPTSCEVTTQSLPDNLSVGTDAFTVNGGFVTTRRGGYSQDDSFHQKPLSPGSSSIMANVHNPQGRSPGAQPAETTYTDTVARKEPSSPRTPARREQTTQSSPERPRSSGSPLKIFGKFDTFTNERLLRRMSKFEEALIEDKDADSNMDNHETSDAAARKADVDILPQRDGSNYRNASRVSSFGDGELDEFVFSDAQQLEPCLPEWPSPPRQEERLVSYSRRMPTKGKDHSIVNRALEPGCETQKSLSLTNHRTNADQMSTSEDKGEASQKSEVSYSINGKRLPQSPAKDPIPKRRRTIHSSEERRMAPEGPIEHSGQSSKPVVGRKRKDALYDSEQQAADPKLLAARQIRRPRNPTPNQASSSVMESPSRKNKEFSNLQPYHGANGASTGVDPPTQIVAGALATVALNTAQDMTHGSRKASIATADFFNEAQQIMRLIRADKRPQSSHDSADTPDIGQQTIYEESVFPESTRDNFSRPPSREGRLNPNHTDPPKSDARIASQLRKFEDEDDLGLALSSSLKLLNVGRSRVASDASVVHNHIAFGEEYENDPPNARIIDSLGYVQPNDRELSSNSQRESQRSNGSTKHSFPTGSSGSSRNRMVIAPENVAHLLSDQIAGMIFDRKRQMWVKRKGSGSSEETHQDEVSPDQSEEDLFGDIPDLSVDEMEELRRVQNGMSTSHDTDPAVNAIEQQDYAPRTLAPFNSKNESNTIEEARPKTADGKSIPSMEDSSARSRYSHLASSGPMPSTRATSWGDDYWPSKTQAFQPPDLSDVEESVGQANEEEVEHEISILEGRVTKAPNQQADRKRQARVVTVAFSSPLVDQMHSPDLRESWDSASQSYLGGLLSDQQQYCPSSKTKRTSMGLLQRPSKHTRARKGSVAEHARPMSRVEEGDEKSLVRFSERDIRPLDLAISTPLPLGRSLLVPPATGSSSLGFQLSSLPDFTVHQIDRPVDARLDAVAESIDSRSLAVTTNHLSLTARDLVKHLTDIEPYEPYWEFVRSIDLPNRALTSLHMLDEFCENIGELNVANNQIEDLNGIPSGVRLLDITHNHLTDFSAWHLLQNLQYLDASGNNLSSLQGLFRSLHLRVLKADNNAIDSLSGLEDLDSLLSVRLRGNKLTNVGFDDYDLRRLIDLNLSCNNIFEIHGVNKLASIKTLNLSENKLEDFTSSSELPYLEGLNLADNRLSSIDIAQAPKLNRLVLDRNAIQCIDGTKVAPHLHHLSWREQQLPAHTTINYQCLQETHHLYLSGNTISSFAPTNSFLNLRTLELASCGLQTLSSDFGQKCPNLRCVNMNFNALRDLEPFLGITKLQKLYLVGNRITRLRRNVAILSRLGAEVSELDLRNNPLTVGFYTPAPNHSSKDEGATNDQGERRLVLQNHHHAHKSFEADSKSWEGEIAEGGTKYYLLSLDAAEDTRFRERLDEDTKIRRRVYEMMLVRASKGLERLDGLEVDRERVAERDGIAERLRELCVLGMRRERGEGGFVVRSDVSLSKRDYRDFWRSMMGRNVDVPSGFLGNF
ncbi:uncharacterized protein KY384_007854 [Bacidia gigantensis]|uniref:uncharacterized protein n=1 Tax=Bacidia gigantensis TaxID=2732470 RepID=UPI001D05B020|nr:uncharacterized protein KY384_007854 [Bacidia gigantensis]KAG8527700.1 hypothetical protein KY384_007854 [Bacidia gigantensis]